MTCAACATRVQKKLSALDDVAASVNFATGKATVTAPVSVPVARLVEAVEQAGYGADLARPAAGAGGPDDAGGAEPDAARVADLRRRLIVALVFFVPLSDLSVLLSLFPWARFPGWQWLLVVLAAPVAGWAAWPFHAAAVKNARHGAASMDTLVSLGIVGGVRLVGLRDVRAGPRAGWDERAAVAVARLRRRDLPGGRRVGDHVLAGRAVV